MKKILILVLLLLAYVPALPQLQTVLKGGPIYMKIFESEGNTGGHAETSTPKPSMFFALAFRYRTHMFNMGGELEYTRRTYHLDTEQGGVSGYTEYSLDVAVNQLRINLEPQFTFGKKVRIFIYPGIYAGYNIHSTITGTSSYNGSGGHYNDNIDEAVPQKWEYGVLLGFGIDIPLRKGFTFVFENMESLNLSDLCDIRYGSFYILDIRFSAGIAYTFGKKP